MAQFYRFEDHLSIPPATFLGDGAQRRSVTERLACFSQLIQGKSSLGNTLAKAISGQRFRKSPLPLKGEGDGMTTKIRSLRLPVEEDQQLERLIKATGKSRNRLIRLALKKLIDSEKGAIAS